jgi:hypothetical protein
MRLRTLAILVSLSLTAVGLFAQKNNKGDVNTRSVEGHVTDSAGNAVAGAAVLLKDTKSLQIRSFITEKDGSYHFAGLNTNVDYDLRAEHNGSSSGSKTLSSFNGRKVATVNLKLK